MKLNAQVIEKMRSVNLDAVDKETLVDASGFVFDNSLPLEKRAARMLEQLKNPYFLSVASGDAITNDQLEDGDYPVFGGGKQMGWSNKHNIPGDTILIGRVGANCGCVSITPKESWATDNALIVSTNSYVKYVYYILVAADLNKLNDANAQPLITGAKVGNCVVPYTYKYEEQKKYNFLTYLVKEIEIGGGGSDFDIADKITASNFKQKKTGEETAPIESKPEVNLPKPNEVYFDEATKKKLSEIIDEINAAYNKNFDLDVASKSALQMRDLLLKNGHLRDSARNNSLKDFRFAYFDAVQDALLEGFEQNQEFFSLLLDNDEKKRELMQVFLEDIYKRLRE